MPIDIEALRERAEWYNRQLDTHDLDPIIDADGVLELLDEIEQLRAGKKSLLSLLVEQQQTINRAQEAIIQHIAGAFTEEEKRLR